MKNLVGIPRTDAVSRGALLVLGACLALGTTGCGGAGPTAEITHGRRASEPTSPVLAGATPRQRFETPAREPRDEGSDDLIAYDLPSGWQAVAPTRERFVNLRPAGDPEASCYLSFLPGNAGGLEANVNRWLTQIGAEPLGGQAIAALPKVPMLGREATLVEAEGTFEGMGDSPPRPGFKLLGLVVSEPNGSLFLKFTGPSGLVDLEHERFLAFAHSLRLAQEHGDVHEGEVHGPDDGHDHGSDGAGSSPAGGLRWSAPAGWIQGAPRAMREVTFAVPGGGECYVTRLAGDAGGVRMNLDRWSGQVGRGALSDEDFAGLARITMLGQSLPILELEGAFTGMAGDTVPDQGLLAVACIRPSDSLFVKLIGPEAAVRAERGNFLAFVGSLEETP